MRRLQNAGLVVLLLAVAGLIASSVLGVGGKAVPAVAARTAAGPVAEPPAGRTKVEVLNASGRPGLAKTVTLYLRDRGFDVVSSGNATTADGTATRVIDRVRRPNLAREVADSLGIASVVTTPDPSLMLDASVILGRDWKMPAGLASAASAPADSASAAAVDSAAKAPPAAAPTQPKPVVSQPKSAASNPRPAAAPSSAAGVHSTKPVSSGHPRSAPAHPPRNAPKR